MFEVKIDGIDPLLKKIDAFSQQIKALQQAVPQELVAWQREDMRRRYPNVETATAENEIAASTEIRARSREPSKDTHHQGPKQHLIARPGPRQHRGRLPPSTRPILREELKQKLHDRMTKLTAEAMKWP